MNKKQNIFVGILIFVAVVSVCVNFGLIDYANHKETIDTPYGIVTAVELTKSPESYASQPFKYRVKVKYTQQYKRNGDADNRNHFWFNSNVSYRIGDTITIK